MTEVNEQPTDEPDSGLDPEVIEQLADDTPADMRTVRRLRSENMRLRHRLRESEANRGDETTLARLAALERQLVEQHAGELLADPADLWLHTDEQTQQAFVDQQFGEVIPDAVRDATRALIESKPHLARRPAAPPSDRPVESLKSGAMPEPKPKPTSWAAAIRGH